MKAKTILLTITIVILMLSFGSGSAFADEGFKGLVPMTADGRWTGGTNLDVAAVAVVTRPHEIVGDSVDFVLKCAGGILKCLFGP